MAITSAQAPEAGAGNMVHVTYSDGSTAWVYWKADMTGEAINAETRELDAWLSRGGSLLPAPVRADTTRSTLDALLEALVLKGTVTRAEIDAQRVLP